MVKQPNPQWVLLSYRMPREPSTPRIAVWRKLKQLGVAQIGDGLVGLPFSAETREQLEWVATSVHEGAGEAIVWLATPTPKRQHVHLANQLRTARNAEYEELLAEIESTVNVGVRTVQKWRRAWHRIDRCDYFPDDRRDHVKQAIDLRAEAALATRAGTDAVKNESSAAKGGRS